MSGHPLPDLRLRLFHEAPPRVQPSQGVERLQQAVHIDLQLRLLQQLPAKFPPLPLWRMKLRRLGLHEALMLFIPIV